MWQPSYFMRTDRHDEVQSSLSAVLQTLLKTPRTVSPVQQIRYYMLRLYVTISYSCWVIVNQYFDLVFRD
jgi:hypothetical protein